MAGSRAGSIVHAETPDGVVLAMRRFPASAARRAVCLCTHAMMANGRYFSSGARAGFAGHLARAGVDTYVLDWRGHGRSATPGDWCFDDYVVLDLPTAVDAVCADAGIEPENLVYMGHSLGGLVGLAALGTGVMRRPRAAPVGDVRVVAGRPRPAQPTRYHGRAARDCAGARSRPHPPPGHRLRR